MLRECFRPKAIRMFETGCPGTSAEALTRLRPDGIRIKRRGKFLLRYRVQIRLGVGSDDIESENELFEPTLSTDVPLAHKMSEGHDIHVPSGGSAIRWGVGIPLGL